MTQSKTQSKPKAQVKLTKAQRRVQLAKARKRAIARENRLFEKLSPADKRVQIARDVLSQIELKKFIPESGVWLGSGDSGGSELFSMKDVEKDAELRDVINKTEVCTGCALGGIFMCAIKRVDDLKIGQLAAVKEAKHNVKQYGYDLEDALTHDMGPDLVDILKYMKRFFTENQLELIELAFEIGSGGISSDGSAAHESARSFLVVDEDRYHDDESEGIINNDSDRLRLIMENIIVNKGTFMPAQKPVAHYVTKGYGIAA
jgi:hypothetical protein